MNALKDKGEEALHSEVSVDAAHSRVHSVRAHTSVSQVSEMEHKVKWNLALTICCLKIMYDEPKI